MGASQSSANDRDGGNSSNGANDTGFVDYYELLQVSQTSTSDEIRKAYRKLALKHHPDKNPDNVQEANKIFHQLQEAYEILSDEQERAWYDQNRERLLNGDGPDFDDEATFDAFRTGETAPPPPTSSARGVTSKTLLRFFDPALAKDFSDHDNGFFGTYRRLFERLAQEERVAASYPGEEKTLPVPSADTLFPSFGYSHTPYSRDHTELHQTPVRDFYTVWTNFQSRKSFGWMDKHDLREAMDRRVKRLMEKENKRARETARKEYNDTVRSLAVFIRKRDPRYIAFQKQVNHGAGSPGDLERKKAEADRIRQEREESAKSYQAQSWQKTEYLFSDDDDQDQEDEDSDDGLHQQGQEGETSVGVEAENEMDDYTPDAWDCVACDKFFKSEAAFRNHEKSAKHKKAVETLRRQMQQEDEELGLGIDVVEGEPNDDLTTPLSQDIRAMGLKDYASDYDADVQDKDQPPPKSKPKKGKKNLNYMDDDQQSISAGFAIPINPPSIPNSAKTKKQRKKDKKKRDLEAVAGMVLDDDGFLVQDLSTLKNSTTKCKTQQDDDDDRDVALLSSDEAVPDPFAGLKQPEIPADAFVKEIPGPLGPDQRPPGSFDVFGYGSIIFKPPPYIIGATPGFIKGYVRRFAQHSIDHRGTPQWPGRVVTLISSNDWHGLEGADDAPEGDIVWGVSYTIDPAHVDVVREYLDFREKNGYTAQKVDVWGMENTNSTITSNDWKTPSSPEETAHIITASEQKSETVLSSTPTSLNLTTTTTTAAETTMAEKKENQVVIVKDALVYVGLPDNDAFVGPQPLTELAKRIYSCQGPSGRNQEYLFNLACAIRQLAPQSVDHHLFTLEKLVLQLENHIVPDQEEIVSTTTTTTTTEKKSINKSKEKCNVCAIGFDSRSKLFNHIRETGHANATPINGTKKGKKEKKKK